MVLMGISLDPNEGKMNLIVLSPKMNDQVISCKNVIDFNNVLKSNDESLTTTAHNNIKRAFRKGLNELKMFVVHDSGALLGMDVNTFNEVVV